MNIFFLDTDPKRAAIYHNDKHCVKMILEYTQLLCTAHRVLNGQQVTVRQNNRNIKKWVLPDEREQTLYAATHINHPCAIWVRHSSRNYTWLHRLLEELCGVYEDRYGRMHKCQSTGLVEKLRKLPDNLLNLHMTVPLAMPDEFKVDHNHIRSYRNYYIGGKSHLASWKVHGRPYWYPDQQPQLINN